MDPVTIAHIAGNALSAAKTAFTVGQTLYDFIQNVKVLDQTAREFANEIDALGAACRLVGSRAQSFVQQHEKDIRDKLYDSTESAQLWLCLERQVTGCYEIVGQLSDAVSCANRTATQSSNFMAQAWRQIKLNMKARDIVDVRNRVKTYTSSLQLTLQSITM